MLSRHFKYYNTEILVAISERLERKASNRILAKIEKRIESALNARRVQKLLE